MESRPLTICFCGYGEIAIYKCFQQLFLNLYIIGSQKSVYKIASMQQKQYTDSATKNL